MRILEETGIRIHHEKAIKLLKRNGIRVDGGLARFTEDQLMEWVDKAPESFTLHARNPKYNITIGGGNTEFSPGYGCASIVNRDSSRRPALLDDYKRFLKLVEVSDYFNINGGIIVQPTDIPDGTSHLAMIYAATTHSAKCIIGMPGRAEKIKQLFELAAIPYGGKKEFCKKPRILTMISTISPLQVDSAALDSILAGAAYNQPLIISPAPAAGTTGPITMAGNISLANAEALACIAIAQMAKPHLPVIYGLQCYAADLRSGNISIGSPGYSLQAAYCALMARMYGLPSRTGGANNDAKIVSIQSAYESMLSMLTSCENGVNLIVHSAGILDSYSAMSYEKFIVDLEIISMIDYYLRDIRLQEDDLAVDVINRVGPGGNFLFENHTADRCHTEPWMPELLTTGSLEGDSPRQEMFDKIEIKIEKMLRAYRKPEMSAETIIRMRGYLLENGVDQKTIDRIDAANPAQ